MATLVAFWTSGLASCSKRVSFAVPPRINPRHDVDKLTSLMWVETIRPSILKKLHNQWSASLLLIIDIGPRSGWLR